jgi:hypothetical protein
VLLFQVGFNQRVAAVQSFPFSLRNGGLYDRDTLHHGTDKDQKVAAHLTPPHSNQREAQTQTLSTAKIVSKTQVTTAQAMVYTVWLFTRPLSFFSPFGIASDGKPALRHWGVLVSELTLLDVQVIMQRTRADAETSLGTMYELFREEGYNNVNIIRPFGIATIRREWRAFSAEYIDTTEMTFETIDVEGTAHLSEFSLFKMDNL